MKKIEFFKHCIDEKDIERANNVLRSIFLTTSLPFNPSFNGENLRYIVQVLKKELYN